MSIADDLQKLQELRASGALSEQEFEQAKRTLLASGGQIHRNLLERELDDSSQNSLGTAANRYVSFHIVMGIIGAIIFLIIFFTVFVPKFTGGPSFSSPPFSPWSH